MIYKYFPRKPVGIIGNAREQKYFTDNAFESAVEAKEYLAIPYEPLYRVKITPNRSHHDFWEQFEGSVTNETKRRTWAAFGLHGGAWEMVTKQQFLKETAETEGTNYAGCWSIDKVLFTGGYIEEYSSFKKATEHDSMLNLLKQFLQSYKSKGEGGKFGEFKEGFQWKIPADFLGGIFYWRFAQFEYTISVLIKAYEDVYSGIKLWGVFWKDDGDKRTFYKPVEVVIPGFPLLTKQEMNTCNNSSGFEQFLNDRFDDVRKTLARKSMSIKANRLTENYDIRLP